MALAGIEGGCLYVVYVYKVDWVAALNKRTVPMFHEWKLATNGVHVGVALGGMKVRYDFAMPLGVTVINGAFIEFQDPVDRNTLWKTYCVKR